MTQLRPVFSTPMGDPYGNGPEIAVRALADAEIYQHCKPLVVGDETPMHYALKVAEKLHGIYLELNVVSSPAESKYTCGTTDLMDLGLVPADRILDTSELKESKPFGVGTCALGGEASFQYVVKVIQLAMDGQINTTMANALSKEAINMAGHHYSGHTEIYADYTKTPKHSVMLAHDELRVVHVSTHVSLRQAYDLMKKDRVLECIRIANEGCKSLRVKEPKITVADLNSHYGGNGLFGTEKIEEIQPAIDIALVEGIHIPDQEPVPADTVFSKALGGWYDITVVMYHDQGHIPLKVKDFVYNRGEKHWEAVARINATLGLPIIRASVDHGTAFGHTGSGYANELSLINAVDYAIRIADAKKEH